MCPSSLHSDYPVNNAHVIAQKREMSLPNINALSQYMGMRIYTKRQNSQSSHEKVSRDTFDGKTTKLKNHSNTHRVCPAQLLGLAMERKHTGEPVKQ